PRFLRCAVSRVAFSCRRRTTSAVMPPAVSSAASAGAAASAWGPPPAACGLSVAKASRAAVTSLVRRAMTRQAASCWYSVWDSSCRAVCSCCRSEKLCSITASHSSCRNPGGAGMLVADGGRGLASGATLSSMSMSSVRGWLFTGSVPCSLRYLTTRRRSKTAPETGEATGCSGASLLRAQHSDMAAA
ncbi:unnamed protein product, partial [Ixodes hexagonus]